MFYMAAPEVSIKFDASCSIDPDLSPQIFGPAAQGTVQSIENFRTKYISYICSTVYVLEI